MFALLMWSASGRPAAVLAPSRLCARTRSAPSKLPAALVKAIAGVSSRWSWKFDTNQCSCVASALRLTAHEFATVGFQVHSSGEQSGVNGSLMS